MNRLILISVFLVAILTFVFACSDLSKTSFNTKVSATNEDATNTVQPTPQLSPKPKNVTPEFLFGGVEISNGELMENSVWVQDAELYNKEKNKEIIITEQMEVDVMNCAGYLGSAIAKYDENQLWGLKFIRSTIPVDVDEKIKKCGESFGNGRVTTYAIAVSPTDAKRKVIKIKKTPDFQKIIKAFPVEVREWGELDDKNLRKNKRLIENGLGNGWTDLDGDGAIDLIIVNGNCAIGSEATCEAVMRLINGKWKQIARVEPV